MKVHKVPVGVYKDRAGKISVTSPGK
jgi:hypothetical protein